jgi:hypothetical protein
MSEDILIIICYNLFRKTEINVLHTLNFFYTLFIFWSAVELLSMLSIQDPGTVEL